MKKIMLSGLCIIGSILLTVNVLAQGVEVSKKYIFVNNTGKDVNDLHIQFDKEVKIISSELTEKFADERAETANGKTTTHFANKGEGENGSRLVKNGAKISGEFKSTDGDFHIEKFWWTLDGEKIGEDHPGDVAKANQSVMLVVPSDDVVTEFEFKNDVYEGKKDEKEAVVNDLHIVTKNPVKPVNRTKTNGDDSEKVGGVFKDSETIKCACDELPDNDKNYETQPRKRARRAMPEPCRTICETCKETRYVTHLSNPDANLPAGAKVPVQFRGDEKTEVEQWWWTQDGKPLIFKESTYQGKTEGKTRKGDENEPAKPNDDWKRGGTMTGGEELYSVALPQPYKPGHAVAVSGGYTLRQSEELAPLLPQEALKGVYENEEIFGQLFERLGGEFFVGELTDYQVVSNPGLAIEGGISFGLWQIRLRGMLSTGQISGRFPIISGSTIREAQLGGKASADWQTYGGSIGIRRFFKSGNFTPFAEGGLTAGTTRTDKLQLEIAELPVYSLPNEINQSHLGAYFRSGVHFGITKVLFLEASAEVEFRSTIMDQGTDLTSILPKGSITIGFNLSAR